MTIRFVESERPVLLREVLPLVMVSVRRRMLIAESQQLLRAGFGRVDGPGCPGPGRPRVADHLNCLPDCVALSICRRGRFSKTISL